MTTTRWHVATLALFTLLVTGCGRKSVPATESIPTQPAPGAGEPLSGGEHRLGPVTYRVPEGWDEQAAEMGEGRVLFAPARQEWRDIGFRPNIGIRIRQHPAMDLGEYETHLRKMLSESVAKLDRLSGAEIRRRNPERGKKIQLTSKGSFSVEPADVGGRRVLVTRFDGVHSLPDGPIASRTFGVQALTKETLYSISLTFPRNRADDFEPVWKSFRAGLKFDSAAFRED